MANRHRYECDKDKMNKETVYIVMQTGYGFSRLCGVFWTRDEATACKKQWNGIDPLDCSEIQTWDIGYASPVPKPISKQNC